MGDIDLCLGTTGQHISELLLDIGTVGFAILIGAHIVERSDEVGADTLLLEVVSHHVGGDDFTLRQDDALLDGGEELLGE